MKHTRIRFATFLLLPAIALLCLCPLATQAEDDKYSPEELEEIVGPIALYPDIVLSSLLPASTVPNDVVGAARWVGEQSGDISEAPEDAGWDQSVEAMVQFPDVLTWMADNMDWMEMLAYALAVQEAEVLQAIQDFRAKANDAGNLESDDHIQVVQESEVIYIQPAQPEVLYVPTYDPYAVTSPGYRWPSWGAGFAMGVAGAWAWNNIGWGNRGGYGSINVNRSPQFNFNNNGNINTGNIGSGNRWNATNKPNRRPHKDPGRNRPNQPGWNKGGGNARPGKGGVKPGKSNPARRPGTRPGDKPGSRPGGSKPGTKPGSRPGGSKPGTKPPSRPGGSKPGTKPPSRPGGSKPGSKPATRPSTPTSRPKSTQGSKSMMSGSSNHGRSTQKASSRGNKSKASSRSRSSGSSRSRSSGGSRGGSRGGGGRGGGGRRR